MSETQKIFRKVFLTWLVEASITQEIYAKNVLRCSKQYLSMMLSGKKPITQKFLNAIHSDIKNEFMLRILKSAQAKGGDT